MDKFDKVFEDALKRLLGPNATVKKIDAGLGFQLPTDKDVAEALDELAEILGIKNIVSATSPANTKIHSQPLDGRTGRNMDFYAAVDAMRQGQMVNRPIYKNISFGINSNGLFYGLRSGEKMCEFFIGFEDMNAKDWFIVAGPAKDAAEALEKAIETALLSASGAHGYERKKAAFCLKLDSLGYMVSRKPSADK